MKPHQRLTNLFRSAALLSMALLFAATIAAPSALAQDLAEAPKQATAVKAPAQTSYHIDIASKSTFWKATLEVQITSLLESNIPNIRVQALQHIIFLSTMYPEDFAFEQAVPQLLGIYENRQADESFRVMALAALHATANGEAMARLSEIVEREPSQRLRLLTKAALNDHYERALPL